MRRCTDCGSPKVWSQDGDGDGEVGRGHVDTARYYCRPCTMALYRADAAKAA